MRINLASYRCDVDAIERLRNAVGGIQETHDPEIVLSDIISDAMLTMARELEKKYNGGVPFEEARARLRLGRRKRKDAEK